MRGAAVADLHLGFRQFSATQDGRNAREQDVERAWLAVVEDVVQARPDLVTIAGDIFHHLRVTDYARLAFLRGLQRILGETDAIIIILQGNHEAARTVESLTPIALATVFPSERVYVVCDFKRILVWAGPEEWIGDGKRRRVAVACCPFTTRVAGATYRLEPDPDADVNILLVHAAVRGADEGDTLPRFYGSDEALDIGRAAEQWDAVCVGDYHEYTRLHPTALAFYSGSIERTSSDIWKEAGEKGWVLYDTEAKTMEFREVATRRMVDVAHDLPFVDAERLNGALRTMVAIADHAYAGAIVRLKVENFPREQREQIDHDLIAAIRAKALHFQLDLKYAALAEGVDMGDRRDRAALSLAEEAAAFFAGDPEEVRQQAYRFLEVGAGVEDLQWAEI